jgi:hypothetical protein
MEEDCNYIDFLQLNR